MGVLGDEQNTAQSTANDVKGAINMGRNAARTAKTVTKAAAEAASGNVAGAAVTVLKDPETMKKILLIALIPFIFIALVMFVFLYALPTAIFETIVSFVDGVADTWDEVEASNDYGGGFLSTLFGCTIKVTENLFEGLGTTLKNAATGIWNSIKSVFADEEGNQTEIITDNASELTIASQEASEKLSIVKKAVAVNKKYQIRAEQIKAVLNGKATSIYNSSGLSIDGFMQAKENPTDFYCWHTTQLIVEVVPMGTRDDAVVNTLEEKLKQMQNVSTMDDLDDAKADFNDAVNDEFPSTLPNGKSNNSYSLSLMSLLTVQQGGSLQSMKMADFMRYLGYYKNSDPKNTVLNVGYAANPFTTSVQSWRGTFKPQYLMEEMKAYQSERNYLQMQVDMNEGGDNDEKLARIAELDTLISNYENSGMAVVDLLIVLDCINLDNWGVASYSSNGNHSYRTYTASDGGSSTLVIDTWYTENALGEITWHKQPTLKIYIVPRDVDSLTSVIGLWNGSLEDAQTGGYVDADDSAA